VGMVQVRSFFGPRPDEIDGPDLEGVEYALDRAAWERSTPPKCGAIA
jgi:hypothetical protein